MPENQSLELLLREFRCNGAKLTFIALGQIHGPAAELSTSEIGSSCLVWSSISVIEKEAGLRVFPSRRVVRLPVSRDGDQNRFVTLDGPS